MKKIRIISALAIISLLMSLMLLPVSAWGKDITVSSDFSYIEYDGEKYIRVSSDELYAVHAGEHIGDIYYEGGDGVISYADAYADENAVELWINFKSGGNAVYYYIKDSILSDFYALVNQGGEEYRIELFRGSVKMTREQLVGKEISISEDMLDRYIFTGDVLFYAFDESISISKGYMINDLDGNYFYVSNIKNDGAEPSKPSSKDKITINQITDEALISELAELSGSEVIGGENDYSDGEIGIGVGIVLLILILGILPLVGAIVTFCISFKCKGRYKLRLRIISALCLLCTVVTAITVIICLAIAV